jgi:hypothetical protein
MKHLFKKGEPRPKNAGRRAGTQNKSSQEVGQFFREILETPAFREKWRSYLLETPLDLIEPKLLILAFSYGYGRPQERVEIAQEQIPPQITFYLFLNGRDNGVNTPPSFGGTHTGS